MILNFCERLADTITMTGIQADHHSYDPGNPNTPVRDQAVNTAEPLVRHTGVEMHHSYLSRFT